MVVVESEIAHLRGVSDEEFGELLGVTPRQARRVARDQGLRVKIGQRRFHLPLKHIELFLSGRWPTPTSSGEDA